MNRNWLRAGAAITVGMALIGVPAFAAPNYHVADHIAGPDGGWDYASFDPVHRRLYISRTDRVTAVDVDSGRLTDHLADAQGTHESLPLRGGGELLVTSRAINGARIVDALSGKLIVDVPTGTGPDAAVFDPASDRALVMNGRGGDVTFIDAKTHAVVGDATIGGVLEFGAVDGAGKAFVNIESKNEIAVLDTRKAALIGRYPLPGCIAPGGLAYAEQAGVLITACQNNVALVVRASDGKVLSTLPIGNGPDAVIYDAKRRLAFIPCGRDGVLEVIAVRAAGDVVKLQTLATQRSARTGALDPKTGRLYLPTANYIAQPTGRPTATPGTFTILVVAPD